MSGSVHNFPASSRERGPGAPFDAVVLASSAGGPHACATVLSGLPDDFCAPILVVQHRRDAGQDGLIPLLAARTPLPVRAVRDGDPLDTHGVGVVPAGHAASLDPLRRIRLVPADSSAMASTSMATVAAQLGPACVGVVLTGRLADGSLGVAAIKRGGGRVLVQDPATAHAAGMPRAAMASGCTDFVLPLERISYALVALAMAPGGSDLLLTRGASPPPRPNGVRRPRPGRVTQHRATHPA